MGSGVIVSQDGFVVTNHHVIEGMTEVKVALADRREYDADVVLRDQRTDLAVLRLKSVGEARLAALPLGDSDQIEVGDIVLAIGNPFGVGQTVTSGIVSALARTQVGVSDYQFFIQTDAAINPGNSGGALLDMQGRLIGINTAIFSRSGGSHGIGFAIPANMVRVVIESARGGGATVRRPWFGARLDSLDREKAEALGLDRRAERSLPTSSIGAPPPRPGCAAATSSSRSTTRTSATQTASVSASPPRAPAARPRCPWSAAGSASSCRSGSPWRPRRAPREPVTIKGRSPLAGLTVVNMSPAVAEELSVDAGVEGVVVSSVEEGPTRSRSASAGATSCCRSTTSAPPQAVTSSG